MAKNLENYYISREPNDMEQQPPKAHMEQQREKNDDVGRIQAEGRRKTTGAGLWDVSLETHTDT